MNAVWRKIFSLFFCEESFSLNLPYYRLLWRQPSLGNFQTFLQSFASFALLCLTLPARAASFFIRGIYTHKLQIDSDLIMINPFEEFENAVWNPRIFWKCCDVKMGCPVTSPTLCSIHWVLRTQGIYDSSNSAKCFFQQASIPTTNVTQRLVTK